MMYSVVQIGANTQLGGLKLGRIISEYQGSLKEVVIKPPITGAIKVIIKIKIKDKYLFFVIIHYITNLCQKIRKKFGS